MNSTKAIVQYEPNNMVMARVQVKSSKTTGTVGKLAIEARGPFRVPENHGNGSYSVQPFGKPDSAVGKFLAQDMYALPPQILPCTDVDLPDFRYLNTNFAPIKHPFKDNFNIESYNSMWLDNKSIVSKPVCQVCGDNIFKNVSPTVDTPEPQPVVPSPCIIPQSSLHVPCPDSVDEMAANLHDNSSDVSLPAGIPVVDVVTHVHISDAKTIHRQILDSQDKLFFISYRGANNIRPRWYLCAINTTDSDMPNAGQYHVDFSESIRLMRRRKTMSLASGLIGMRSSGLTRRNRVGIMDGASKSDPAGDLTWRNIADIASQLISPVKINSLSGLLILSLSRKVLQVINLLPTKFGRHCPLLVIIMAWSLQTYHLIQQHV